MQYSVDVSVAQTVAGSAAGKGADIPCTHTLPQLDGCGSFTVLGFRSWGQVNVALDDAEKDERRIAHARSVLIRCVLRRDSMAHRFAHTMLLNTHPMQQMEQGHAVYHKGRQTHAIVVDNAGQR